MTAGPPPAGPPPAGLLLVGGAGPAPLGVDIAVMIMEQAGTRGIRTHLMSHEADLAKTVVACELAASASVVDFEDAAESVAWVRERVRDGERFDVVFSGRELAQVTTAEIAAVLGVTGNAPEAVTRVRT
jgi:hypothetical protein